MIENCQNVTLETDSLSNATQVNVINVALLYLQAGFISEKCKSFSAHNVGLLNAESKSFFNLDLDMIQFKNLAWSIVVGATFLQMRVRSFSMMDCTLDLLEANALRNIIDVEEFILDNCTLGIVEPRALQVETAELFQVSRCHLQVVSNRSFISQVNFFNLTANEIGQVLRQGFLIEFVQADIVDNTFRSLSSLAFNGFSDAPLPTNKTFRLLNNTFLSTMHHSLSPAMSADAIEYDLRSNSFQCQCSPLLWLLLAYENNTQDLLWTYAHHLYVTSHCAGATNECYSIDEFRTAVLQDRMCAVETLMTSERCASAAAFRCFRPVSFFLFFVVFWLAGEFLNVA